MSLLLLYKANEKRRISLTLNATASQVSTTAASKTHSLTLSATASQASGLTSVDSPVGGPYSPPSGSGVNFLFSTGGYSAPTGSAVNFQFGVGPTYSRTFNATASQVSTLNLVYTPSSVTADDGVMTLIC